MPEDRYPETDFQHGLPADGCEGKTAGYHISQAESFLMIPDYLNFLLTGVQKQEYTNATTTQLVNPSERTWDRELIEALGYPQKLFGRLSMPEP